MYKVQMTVTLAFVYIIFIIPKLNQKVEFNKHTENPVFPLSEQATYIGLSIIQEKKLLI